MAAWVVTMTLRTGKRSAAEAAGRFAFTLIELMLVMAILVVVLSVTASSLTTFFRGRTLDAEARRFVALTRYAQSRAVAEGAPMLLWIDREQGQYGLQMDPGYVREDLKAAEFNVQQDLQIEAGLPLANAMASPVSTTPAIRFTPDGFISDTSPETIYIRDGDREVVLIGRSQNRLNYEIQTNTLASVSR